MKNRIVALLAMLGFAIGVTLVAQTPAPQPSTPPACTVQEIPDLYFGPRIIKSFGLLTVNAEDKPILVRKPTNTILLPALVTSTPCLSKKGNLVYFLTAAQAPKLFALKP